VKGTTSPELRQCTGCGYWTLWLSLPGGRCRDCVLGWYTCPTGTHGGLEYGPPGPEGEPVHRRVTVRMVTDAIPVFQEAG
jgi:hypothetical protein